jgi:hypothetical protein
VRDFVSRLTIDAPRGNRIHAQSLVPDVIAAVDASIHLTLDQADAGSFDLPQVAQTMLQTGMTQFFMRLGYGLVSHVAHHSREVESLFIRRLRQHFTDFVQHLAGPRIERLG